MGFVHFSSIESSTGYFATVLGDADSGWSQKDSNWRTIIVANVATVQPMPFGSYGMGDSAS